MKKLILIILALALTTSLAEAKNSKRSKRSRVSKNFNSRRTAAQVPSSEKSGAIVLKAGVAMVTDKGSSSNQLGGNSSIEISKQINSSFEMASEIATSMFIISETPVAKHKVNIVQKRILITPRFLLGPLYISPGAGFAKYTVSTVDHGKETASASSPYQFILGGNAGLRVDVIKHIRLGLDYGLNYNTEAKEVMHGFNAVIGYSF